MIDRKTKIKEIEDALNKCASSYFLIGATKTDEFFFMCDGTYDELVSSFGSMVSADEVAAIINTIGNCTVFEPGIKSACRAIRVHKGEDVLASTLGLILFKYNKSKTSQQDLAKNVLADLEKIILS